MQDDDGNLIPAKDLSGLDIKENFGQSPLVLDINDDGYLDVVYINMNGPLRVLINNGGNYGYVKAVFPDSVSSLGASLTLISSNGKEITKNVVAGTGFSTDHSNEIIFGIGEDDGSFDLRVEWLSGEIEIFENIGRNEKIFV